MTLFYVRSTTGSDTNNGSTWALAKATIAGAATSAVAGDTIYASQVHAETNSSSLLINSAGTALAPVKIMCVNDSAMPPTALAATAAVLTTGPARIQLSGATYFHGVAFTCGNGSNYSILSTEIGQWKMYFNACTFTLADTHPSSLISFGSVAANESSESIFRNCGFKNLAPSNWHLILSGRVAINGGSFLAGSSNVPGSAFKLGGAQRDSFFTCENFDFSNLASNINIFASPNGVQASGVVRNCKLPAGWTGLLISGAFSQACWRAEMYNCDSGATNYKLWIEDYTGSIKSEAVVVMTGGASDGTTPLSWKMTSNANANELVGQLISGEIAVWNDTAGSVKTVTVNILHDSVAALTDAEAWIEVSELGTSGSTLGVSVTSRRADVMTTPGTLTTSATTWTTTGLTNPNKQKMSVTFTPANKGPFMCRVVLGKASKTIYVDPTASVT